MEAEFNIGKIVRPHGVKGAVKAETYTSDASRFKKVKRMRVGSEEMAVESLSADDSGYIIIKFNGVDTADAAETLRGKNFSVLRGDLPKPPDGTYYIQDLIGSAVSVDGEFLGTLIHIDKYGSADVYEVKIKSGAVSFPALKDVFRTVDIEKGEINLNGYYFNRVAVYNSETGEG